MCEEMAGLCVFGQGPAFLWDSSCVLASPPTPNLALTYEASELPCLRPGTKRLDANECEAMS